MQLQHSSWPEIEAYLKTSKAILIPIGSIEQHGPVGLLGTDAICAEFLARQAAELGDFLVAPAFNVGQAQHHMAFPGTITLRPSTMIAAILDWANSFRRHGFERLYWLNGHGGNLATINAAFAEIHHATSFDTTGATGPMRCMVRNWWELAGVADAIRELFPSGEGSHATPSEISLTQFAVPGSAKTAEIIPRYAPTGPIFDAEDFRRRYPDGRIGSDPAQANPQAGERLASIATRALVREFKSFAVG